MTSDGPWIGLDVGGANLKAAHEDGTCATLPFALWRDPGRLPERLGDLLRGMQPFARLAVTMTAELCDCYESKAHGVRSVLEAVLSVASGRPVSVWCVDGQFRTGSEVVDRPELAAASNWLALAEVAAARLVPEETGILIDVGTTTTDLIPLVGGHARPRGRTDTERLAAGELVYAGVRRTPLCALVQSVPFRGVTTGVAAELFATTLDVYLTLGSIAPDSADVATADGRPATIDAARARLARMIGADGHGFTAEDSRTLSAAVHSALLDRLVAAARSVGTPATFAVLAGSGEFLAQEVARRVLPAGAKMVSLARLWGVEATSAACAHALVILACENP